MPRRHATFQIFLAALNQLHSCGRRRLESLILITQKPETHYLVCHEVFVALRSLRSPKRLDVRHPCLDLLHRQSRIELEYFKMLRLHHRLQRFEINHA